MIAVDTDKKQLDQFGRSIALLLNRAFMYQADHPYLIDSIESTCAVLNQLLTKISPLVFILNRDQFYIDEEPVDPRVNLQRMAVHFKKADIESISFYKGVNKDELRPFIEILIALDAYPNADTMQNALFKKGIQHIKINHVFYKKMSADEEVVSREALKQINPQILDEAQGQTKQLFMDTILQSVLLEEFATTLNLQKVLKNPTALTDEMVAADLKTAQENENENQGPGFFLLQQLQLIEQEVDKNLEDSSDLDVSDMASALFDLRQKLFEEVEAQKSMGVVYANEEEIYDTANEITDKVIITLVREEYKAGKISTERLAHILRRLIPETQELKRFLPKIKTALLEDGMAPSEFRGLIEELSRELQSESLANILAESSEEIGVDGHELIQDIKDNPVEAAELIYLASEIRKGGGDEKALTDLLVDYVERLGSDASRNISDDSEGGGEKHFNRIMAQVKSNVFSQLGEMDLNDDVLSRLEQNIGKRVDDVLDKLRVEWVRSQAGPSSQEPAKELTVLASLEKSVGEDDDIHDILKAIRAKVASGEIDENDFTQIYPEIVSLEQSKKSRKEQRGLAVGIMGPQSFLTLLNKEIARAKRYKIPLSALGFSLVKVKAKTKPKPGQITNNMVIDAVLLKLAEVMRTSDVVGTISKNQLVALLPMTSLGEAKLALRRVMKFLHLAPIEIEGASLEINVAGVAMDIDFNTITNASTFAKEISGQLTNMAARIRNIHAY
jgi:hypothetical protein